MEKGKKATTAAATATPNSVPAWASMVMLAVVISSSVAVVALAPKYAMEYHAVLKVSVVNYIVMAIPFFFLMQFAEGFIMYMIDYHTVGSSYRLADSWSSLSAGMVQQMINKLRVPLGLAIHPYLYIWNNYAICRFNRSDIFIHIIALLAIDFCYYWLHRMGHVVAVLWAGHSVHHNNNSYNLATALRQSWLQGATSWMFYLPLAFFFDPVVALAMEQLNTYYQFWVHTCIIRRLGVLELFLMTPSHHRIHHERRVHKNYGGLLIVWDRMFSTFLDETDASVADEDKTVDESHAVDNVRSYGSTPDGKEEVCYFGTMLSPTSWTESVLQMHQWNLIFGKIRSGAGIFKSLWYGPGYYTTAKNRVLPAKSNLERLQLRSNLHSNLGRLYIIVHFFVMLGVFLVALTSAKLWLTQLKLFLFCFFTLLIQGLIFDGKCYVATVLECVRCGIAVGVSWVVLGSYPTIQLGLIGLYAMSAVACLAFSDKLLGTKFQLIEDYHSDKTK